MTFILIKLVKKNAMKLILTLIAFIVFATVVIFGGEYLYDQKNANSTVANTANAKANLNLKQAEQQPKINTNSKKIIEKTPPHFLMGFDWSLPSSTQISKNSGLTGMHGHSPKVVKNRFVDAPEWFT